MASRSALTGWLACTASTASNARSLAPPIFTARPSARTSSGPRIPTSIAARTDINARHGHVHQACASGSLRFSCYPDPALLQTVPPLGAYAQSVLIGQHTDIGEATLPVCAFASRVDGGGQRMPP